MAKIKMPWMKELSDELDAQFAEWQTKQSPLARSTDKLESTTAQLELSSNEAIYNKLNPFNMCGKFDLRFMEETFGYTNGRTMYASGSRDAKEQIDALRKHNEEDFFCL